MVSFSSHGEMSERFKEPVLKTGDGVTHRGFESHSLRQEIHRLMNASAMVVGISLFFVVVECRDHNT